MAEAIWAHIRVDPETGKPLPHLLDEHLSKVGELAGRFADGYGKDWAQLAGLWHDLGKFRPGFQRYIRQANNVDAHIEGRIRDRDKTHSAAGALWAERLLAKRFGPSGQLMARVLQYLIAGHHAGLDNWDGALAARLAGEDARRELEEALAQDPPETVLRPEALALLLKTAPLGDERATTPGRFALWARMLFSALIDADFLDTESFMDGDKSAARKGSPGLPAMKAALDAHMSTMTQGADDTPVNRLRADILAQCR